MHTSLPRKLSDQLEQIQRRALCIIIPHLSYTNGLNELDLTTLEEQRESLCKSINKNNNLNTASKLCSLLPDPVDHYYNLRNPRKLPCIYAEILVSVTVFYHIVSANGMLTHSFTS